VPSPFPGMDPYLEHPSTWPGVHQGLITYTRDHLQVQLGDNLYVDMGERIYIEEPDRSIYPDVFMAEMRRKTSEGGKPGSQVMDQPEILVLEAVQRREPFLEIKDARKGHRVLTVIEVLSPTNKRAGPGRKLYRRKQREVLKSSAHLVEIDLLRGGRLTIAVPREPLRKDRPYRVAVSRADDRSRRELYAFGLRDRLPRVAIPVAPHHPDLALDLPAVFSETYDKGVFARRIDYREEPVPALHGDDVAWAREMTSGKS
jgi:hypothetical protein